MVQTLSPALLADASGLEAFLPSAGGPVDRRALEAALGERWQLEADRKWWPIASARRRFVRAMVYVAAGTLVRVRLVTEGAPGTRTTGATPRRLSARR
ncbi:hypothetical protein QMK19_02515 [Streptomyces sp. H10-C2]|uniref:hypothetical protein n=1 Tax=unclassified Streptomyces TaxID=2593676 RepID=UPI0024B8838F|nr:MULTISPECIES: hypothetical protein [unclassified Streptomyces]MDJ0344044.1 hypothetical protein [Streptomyces sp. PH10-H1]MDJ0368582.1 hypothetical protein [Streptomyces sp. H10-C2]